MKDCSSFGVSKGARWIGDMLQQDGRVIDSGGRNGTDKRKSEGATLGALHHISVVIKWYFFQIVPISSCRRQSLSNGQLFSPRMTIIFLRIFILFVARFSHEHTFTQVVVVSGRNNLRSPTLRFVLPDFVWSLGAVFIDLIFFLIFWPHLFAMGSPLWWIC